VIATKMSLELWFQAPTPEHRDAVIEDHRYLCTRAARKFWRDGVDRRDLEQVAAVGLIKAVDRFNPAQGTPFDGYAWVMILGELMHYVRDTERLVRVPRRIRDIERKWIAAERELLLLLGREPSEAELAEHSGASTDEQRELERFRRCMSVLSVEALRPFEHRTLAYTMERDFDRLAIEDSIDRLEPIEREILREIYEHDTPIVTVAQRLGYSRRHITRLHRAALKKLSPLARPH
jgi:RNA polymerase sigma-B factor